MHIHVCWSRWLLWTRPWGPWRGPPLVRLLALNRASGRFPFFLLQASLPPPPGVPLSRFPFPLPPATSQLREGCGLRPPGAAVCPESVSRGARGCRVLVPCLLPGSSRKGRTRKLPRGHQGPGLLPLSTSNSQEPTRPLSTCHVQPCTGASFPDQALLPSGPWEEAARSGPPG